MVRKIMDTKKLDNKLIELGSCMRPHGIAGAFSAHFFNSEGSALEKGLKLTLFPKSQASSIDSRGESFTVKSVRFGNKAIISFEEVTDRNRAEEIIPFKIFISRDQLPEPEDDEFYIEDLIGMKVLSQSGEEIGVLENYFDNGAQLVVTIKKARGKVEVPFVESFFPECDFENRVLTFIEPEII